IRVSDLRACASRVAAVCGWARLGPPPCTILSHRVRRKTLTILVLRGDVPACIFGCRRARRQYGRQGPSYPATLKPRSDVPRDPTGASVILRPPGIPPPVLIPPPQRTAPTARAHPASPPAGTVQALRCTG